MPSWKTLLQILVLLAIGGFIGAARLDLASPLGRNKLTAYLLKQGYDAALIRDVVKEIVLAAHHE